MNCLLRRANFLHRFSQRLRYVPSRGFALDEDGAIDGMKSSVSFLTHENEDLMLFSGYSPIGFRLGSGIRVLGPCAVFPRSILNWNVAGIEDVNEASLSLFTLLEPKIDILVLGVGEHENMAKVDLKVIRFLRSKKIGLEILPTDQALATFNFLNTEKRYVAGALIPPGYIQERQDMSQAIRRADFWLEEDNMFISPESLPYRPDKKAQDKLGSMSRGLRSDAETGFEQSETETNEQRLQKPLRSLPKKSS